MAADENSVILSEAAEAVVMAIGRERNAVEFYSYLAETVSVSKAREFFEKMAQRELDDMKELELFLAKLNKKM